MSGATYEGSFSSFIFKRAVDFLKTRKSVTKQEYMAMADEERAKSFMVSGYEKLQVIQRFQDALTEAVEQGKTREQFQEEMNSFLKDSGYELLNPWKSDVIFRTNVQTAYNAGHYQSMTQPETLRLLPYWQYKTAYDDKVRADHALMHNRVWRADDPIWDVWYPPNGFRCRCTVVAKSRAQVEREGLVVENKPPRGVDMTTGEVGGLLKPDKGFSMNPAKAAYKPDLTNIDRPLREIYKRRMQAKR